MSQTQNLVALKQAKDRAIELLSQRYAEGVIDNALLETRLDIVQRANNIAEIEDQLEDLREPESSQMHIPQALVTTGSRRALTPISPSQNITAILSGATRKGHWTPARVNRVLSILGGAELDFRQAVLPAGTVDVHITAVLGGVSITVPPDVIVENEVFGFLGGVEFKGRADDNLDAAISPRIRLRGIACLGGVEVHIKSRS